MPHKAVVVAHPDDETLWAGGLIARNPGITVICCTIPRRDPIRALRFFDACACLGARGVLVPFQEPEPTEDITHLDAISIGGFDVVFTHNALGEYGHRHHQNVHDWVSRHATGKVVPFGYGHDDVDVLRLTAQEQAQKLAALQCYDHQSPSDGGKTKWEALLERYDIDMTRETFCAER